MQSWRKWFQIILMVQSLTLECESSAVCPHPGVPVHGFGVVLGDDRPILPISHRQFSVGESLNFFCSKDRRIPSNQKATITCQSDGTWNGTIPRCDQSLDVRGMIQPSPMTCQNSRDISILLIKQFQISDVRITLCQESQGDANVALLTRDAAIIANCRKTEELLFTQTFSCEHLIARDLNSIQIQSAVPISSVAILVHSGYECGYPPELSSGTWQWINATQVRYECIDPLQMAGDEYVACHPQTGLWGAPPICQHVVNTLLFIIVVSAESGIILILSVTLLWLIIWKRMFCFKKKPVMEPIDMFLTNIQDRIDFMRSMDEVSNHGVDNPAATNDNMDSLPVPSRQSNMPMQMFY